MLVDARLAGAPLQQSSNAAISVALISLLDMAPHLERCVDAILSLYCSWQNNCPMLHTEHVYPHA